MAESLKRHHFHLGWEKIRAVSTHWELGWSFLLLFLVGLVPFVVSLRQYQPCSYTMFGTRRVWHVSLLSHLHTFTHWIMHSQSWNREVSVCSAPCSFFWDIWVGSSKKFRIWKLYFLVLLHIFFFANWTLNHDYHLMNITTC